MDANNDAKHVLFVDDEASMPRRVGQALRGEGRRLTFVADGAQALRVLERDRVDLLITSLTMPVIDGVELLRHVANRSLTIPVIVVTDREPPPPVPGSPLWFVREPLDPASLVALIRERLAAPPLGSAVAIAELAQILAMERRSCTLRVHLKGVSGELLFNGGVLVDAAVGGLAGDAAARVLLSWRRAMLRVEPPGRARKPTVLSELAALMPGLTVLSADTGAVALAGDRVTSMTAHVSAALTEHTTPTAAADPPSAAPERRTALRIVPPQPEPPPVHVPAWERPAAQAPIAALLTDALKIDGAIGAALAIWELDHCLGARSAGPALAMDGLRTTLSGNCRVMRAMMSTLHRLGQSPKISDVLITLDDQIHVLSPVLRHDGLFLDLVLDRARGTLALARLQVRGLLERFSLVDEP